MDVDSKEVLKIEVEIRDKMKQLIELDRDAILRIEKIFQKVRVERAVEMNSRPRPGAH